MAKMNPMCTGCKQFFEPKYEWQQMCWPCFFKTAKGEAYAKRQREQSNGFNQREGGDSDYSRYQGDTYDESDTFQQRKSNSDRAYGNFSEQAYQQEQQRQRQRAYEEASRQKKEWQRASEPNPFSRGGAVSIDKDFIRKLLQLCHPDRHNGSELANNVTMALLKLKKDM